LTRRTPACARGQGWVEYPGHSRRLFLCSSFAYVPVRGRSTMSRAGRTAILLFSHIALPLLQRRGTRFISGSNKALATVPFPGGDDRPSVEAANSCSTRMVRLRDGWRPYQPTSGPAMLKGRWLNSAAARHSSEDTRFSITLAHPSSSTTWRKAYCQGPNAAPFASRDARAITWPHPTSSRRALERTRRRTRRILRDSGGTRQEMRSQGCLPPNARNCC